MNGFMKFDMHCHTKEGSIDSGIPIYDYCRLLKAQGFSGMLPTDHDSVRGYQYWRDHRDNMPEDFIVVSGIEYDTRDAGHFIVIMPEEEDLLPLRYRGMNFEQLERYVHSRGGVMGAAHPYGIRSASIMYSRKCRDAETMDAYIRSCDFIEGLNTCETVTANAKARSLAEAYGLPCTGGTDAHREKYVGMAFTAFDRDIFNAADMVEAIRTDGIAAFGGQERTFLPRHKSRNWLATTIGFKAFNLGMSGIYTPIRAASRRRRAKMNESF